MLNITALKTEINMGPDTPQCFTTFQITLV